MTQRCFDSRPDQLDGWTERIDTPVGPAYITINYFDARPSEVFIVIGKTGTNERAAAEALGRLLSVALQHGVPLALLARQLRGISSEATMGFGLNKILSMPDAVGRVLEDHLTRPALGVSLTNDE